MEVTVKTCAKKSDWTGKDGKQVPIYLVTLSDGSLGESFGKEIPVGTNKDQLEITPNGNYNPKFKLKGSGGGNPFPKQKAGNESFALSYAKDVAVAHIGNGKEFKAEDIIKVANVFYNWLEEKKSK